MKSSISVRPSKRGICFLILLLVAMLFGCAPLIFWSSLVFVSVVMLIYAYPVAVLKHCLAFVFLEQSQTDIVRVYPYSRFVRVASETLSPRRGLGKHDTSFLLGYLVSAVLMLPAIFLKILLLLLGLKACR